ncbi:MAG: sigma-70 family RNA polymerase sigma factor [Abditibacteriota bacterium]|nr:sigma-70 family RNA polymerase sigma factor [Abditibacteriota bacterium]
MADNPKLQLLIRKCKRGDRRAFDDLMSIHEKQVYGFALGLLKNKNYEEASDITIEAFIRAFKAIASFRNDCNFSSWLFTIVKNVYIDRLKANKKFDYASLDSDIETDDGTIQREIGDDALNPEETVESEERSKEIWAIVETLPEIQSTPIKLYFQEGLGYEEIAEKLNVPVGTVKSRINRAKAALEEKLADFR